MLRSIKSGQRKVRVLALKVSNGSLAGPDQKKASISGFTVTFNQPFAEAPVVVVSSGTGLTTISSVTASGFTADEACDVIIMGSDTAEKY